MVWIAFLIALAIILFAGTKLARYGDAIAEKTGMGRLWVGMILLAAITSIPELSTGVSAAGLVGQPDLAIGALFGSNIFNLAILALIDIAHPMTPILSMVSSRQLMLAYGAVVLTVIAGIAILAGDALSGISLGWVGIGGIAIFGAYIWFAWRMYKGVNGDKEEQPLVVEDNLYDHVSLRSVWFKFSLAALAVIGAGIWVSFLGDEIALVTGLDTTFVGSLFLAVSTSMPELVVTFAALRIGAAEMAVADILGSNMFNMVVILAVDISYTKEAILSMVSNTNLITAVTGIIMTLLVVAGLRWRRKVKFFRFVSWYGALLLVLYLAGFYFLYSSGLD